MNGPARSNRGAVLEELLRAYFLRSGFFVIRGVPFKFADEDATDVDLWLYERPTGTSRRVQICDIKYKQRPKAVERLLWTKGLAAALDVDDAYVATTDKRHRLRSLAAKLGINLIDGNDLARIQASQSVNDAARIGDEELVQMLKVVDSSFRTKSLQEARADVLSSLSEGFGSASAVRSLEAFGRLASYVISSRPDSDAARAAGRLAYLAAAIACISVDYLSVAAALRPAGERRDLILNAVRYGALSGEQGQYALKLALALVEKYSPNGKSVARATEAGLKADLENIPAEVVADQAIRLIRADMLFTVARELESAAYANEAPNFDALSVPARSMLGALLDYGNIDRARFSSAWSPIVLPSTSVEEAVISDTVTVDSGQPELFVSSADADASVPEAPVGRNSA